MAWLLRSAGMAVTTLQGGYKAYRALVLEDLARPVCPVILGGTTGSGKTYILHELAKMGEQILDLEGLAHHKGSTFGAFFELPQPSVEQFENDLHLAFMQLDHTRRIWVEDESMRIGTCLVPRPFWLQMVAAPVVAVEIPLEERVAHLVQVYAGAPTEALSSAIVRIRKRLGGQHEQAAHAALAIGDFAGVARITLAYYDKTYRYGLSQRADGQVKTWHFEGKSPAEIAMALIGTA